MTTSKPKKVWVDKFHPNNARLTMMRVRRMSDEDIEAWIKFGKNEIEKFKNPSERLIVFLIVAAAWRDIEKLGSDAKTHQWLLEHKVISPKTDRAETSRFFREINLPKGKSGRPKNENTDTGKIG